MRGTIDDFEVYLDESQLPAFTLSVNSVIDPSKVQGTSSTTLRLIATKETRRLLGGERMAEVANDERPVLRIGDDSVDLFRSSIVAVRKDRDIVECIAVGGNAAWFELAKGIVLKDYEWDVITGPTVFLITSSWSDPYGLIMYPLIDYGAFEGEDETYDVQLEQFRPGVRIAEMIKRPLAANGWTVVPKGKRAVRTWQGYLYQGPTDKALVVSSISTLGGLGLEISTLPEPEYAYAQVGEEPQPIPFNDVIGGSFPGYDFGTFKFTMQEDGNVHPSFDFNIYFPDDVTYLDRRFRVVLWDETDGIELSGAWSDPVIDDGFFDADFVPFQGTLEPKFVPAGHVIYLGIQIDGTVVDSGAIFNSNSARLDFEIEYSARGRLVVGTVMPTGTLADVMREIATVEQFVYVTNESNKVIEVWAVEDYFRKPTQSTPSRDWTNRMDHTSAPARLLDQIPTALELKWAEDDGDRMLGKLSRISNGKFANAYVPIPRGYAQPKVVQSKWAASYSGRVLGDCLIPIMRKEGEEVGVDVYSIKPRLLYAPGTTKAGDYVFDGDPASVYPNVYFILPPNEEAEPMAFDNPVLFSATQEVAIDHQWAYAIRQLKDAEILEAFLFIRDHELKNFDFGLPTLIDDGSGPAWYWVQEISGHKFGTGLPTKCKLVKIPGKEVSIDRAEVVALPVVPQPFLCAGAGYAGFVFSPYAFVNATTTTGYFATRVGGVTTVHESNADVEDGAVGMCVWSSDQFGNPAGSFTSLYAEELDEAPSLDGLEGVALTSLYINGLLGNYTLPALVVGSLSVLSTDGGAVLDLSALTGTTYLRVDGGGVSGLIIPVLDTYVDLVFTGLALAESDVDAIITAAYESCVAGAPLETLELDGGTTEPPSGAVAGILAILTGSGGVIVSGTGDADADGTYSYVYDLNGKPAYLHDVNLLSEIFWTGSEWRNLYDGGFSRSTDDTAQPWEATGWTVVSGGAAAPTVSPGGFGVTVTTN
jgi:hypothetical protein